MGIDWEEVLGADGADLADAYEDAIAFAVESEERAKLAYGDEFQRPAR